MKDKEQKEKTKNVKIWERTTKKKNSKPIIPPKDTVRKEKINTQNSESENGSQMLRENLSKFMRRNILRSQMLEGGKSLKADKSYRLSQFKKILAIGIILIFIIVLSFVYNTYRRYHEYSIVWQNSQTDTASLYTVLNGEILIYSKDGVSLLDKKGKIIWTKAYTMNAPKISLCEGYVVIYDKEGTIFYVLDSSGCIGEGSTTRPILKAVIASQGVVATIQGESSNGYTYIDYYNKDGSSLDIGIRTTLAGSGYPLDIDISPNGTQLITSYAYLDSGVLNNQVVFYNFDVGKNEPGRTVGGFGNYNQTMIPEVAFLSNDMAVAFSDSQLDFYSLANALQPERYKSCDFKGKTVKSIFYHDEYAGIVFEKEDGEDGYLMQIYRASGKLFLEKTIDFDYKEINLSDSGIVVRSDTLCKIYNLNGSLKYSGSFSADSILENVLRISEKDCLVTSNNIIERISFK